MPQFFSRTPVGGRRLSRKLGLHANNSQFTLAGEPFRILGGSVHYFRVPSAYWRDRLMKAKACGINTITTYVPWSLHQPERDVFNFQTQLDLDLVAELGLWVILRPGPYISAELDLGGLPSWLLQDENMRLRTTYPGFTDAVNVFFDKLIPKIVPLQFKKGGPIIAIQLDDSYGSYAKDNRYMAFIKEALTSRGVSEMLLTSDLSNGLKPNSPAMVTDIWSGMADAWGDLHHVLAPEDMVSTVREILRRGMSINLYMFHGGTSFGFMSGALGIPSYKAIVPSYDYDAPLSEAGEYTPKYHLLRDLFSRYNSESEQSYNKTLHMHTMTLILCLPFKSATPVNMENLPVNNKNGQSQGYTLYETTITSGGLLKSGDNVRDRALVFVDRRYIGFFKRNTLEMAVPDGEGKRTLSLLVENCGRVHRGKDLDKQRKGLVGDVLLNGTPLRDFTIYSLDMKPSFIDRFWKARPEVPLYPAFLMGALFAYGYPSDTFVKLPGWGRGVVFINGLNLGRYWSSGPQQALYLPGPFLNSGMNQIIAFEEQEADYKIQLEDTHDLGMTADIK
uniref:Beta-galactosidase-1-like protein 2 n=1 Tax=Gadus morhua TaxID=8049 RepID=A0A8C4ZYF1_GADMO